MGRFSFEAGPSKPECGTSTNVFEALGEVVNCFEQLDDQVANAISFLIGRGEAVGRIVTAELSFRVKVNLLGVLFAHERPNSQELAELREWCVACLQVEDRRNQFVHSTWRRERMDQSMVRVKYTARGKRGIRSGKPPDEHTRINEVDYSGYIYMLNRYSRRAA